MVYDQITCIKHGPRQSLLPRLQAFHLEEEEIDPFNTNVTEEEMAQEDVAHLILYEDEEILDIDIES